MNRPTRSSADAEGLDYLFHTARRIHRLADQHLATRECKAQLPGGAVVDRTLKSQPDSTDSGGYPEIPGASLVAGVAERFAASMVVTFGGRQMVNQIGRWVKYAAVKRAEPD
jgi:hypothetical protein